MKSLIQIWMQPIYARLNMHSKKALCLILAMFPIVGEIIAAIIYYFKPYHGIVVFAYAFGVSIAAALICSIWVWYFMLLHSIGMQYSPANAHLIPHLVKRMKLAVLLPVLILATIVVFVPFAALTKWSFFPGMMVFLAASAVIVTMRSIWMLTPIMVLVTTVPTALDGILPSPFHIGFWGEMCFVLISILSLGSALWWFFSIRDQAHFQFHQRAIAFRNAMGGLKGVGYQEPIGISAPFLIWMRRCVKAVFESSEQTKIKRRVGLIPFGLGSRVHWTNLVIQILGMVLLGVLFLTLIDFIKQDLSNDFYHGTLVGVGAASFLMMPFLLTVTAPSLFYQTRNEQAILSLAPVVHGWKDINRVFLNYVLRQFFILFGLSVLAAVALLVSLDKGSVLPVVLVLVVSSVLNLSLGVTYQLSQVKSASDTPVLRNFLRALLLFAMGIALLLFLSNIAAIVFAIFEVIVTLVLLRRRYLELMGAPQFPVGRALA